MHLLSTLSVMQFVDKTGDGLLKKKNQLTSSSSITSLTFTINITYNYFSINLFTSIFLLCQPKEYSYITVLLFKMYTLFYGLWKYLFQKDEYFVLILGLDNAGKTTFLEQTKTKFSKNYKGLNPNKITTTVGLNIGRIDMHGVRLNFWDLGGQEDLQVLWDKYYAECHAVIYIVDSSDIDRLQESKEAFDKMITNPSLVGVPLLLVANKQDVPKCLTIGRIKEVFRESKHLIGRRDCHVLAGSALHGDGVHEGIEWVVHRVRRNTLRPPKKNDDS